MSSSQTDETRTLTEALADIGVSHGPSPHFGCRTLFTAEGRVIDDLDIGWGWDFVRQAEAAA